MENDNALGPLEAAKRRELTARGNRLRAGLVVGRNGVNDAVVAQVRRMLAGRDLIKVRVDVDRGQEAGAVGETLARDVPCHFVKRVGKVVLLWRGNQAIEKSGSGEPSCL